MFDRHVHQTRGGDQKGQEFDPEQSSRRFEQVGVFALRHAPLLRGVLNNLDIEGSAPWLLIVLYKQRMGMNGQDLKW